MWFTQAEVGPENYCSLKECIQDMAYPEVQNPAGHKYIITESQLQESKNCLLHSSLHSWLCPAPRMALVKQKSNTFVLRSWVEKRRRGGIFSPIFLRYNRHTALCKFKLCRTIIWLTYTLSPLYLWVLHPWIQPTMDQKHLKNWVMSTQYNIQMMYCNIVYLKLT